MLLDVFVMSKGGSSLAGVPEGNKCCFLQVKAKLVETKMEANSSDFRAFQSTVAKFLTLSDRSN